MTRSAILTLLLMLGLSATPVTADTLIMDQLAPGEAQTANRPVRGMSMQTVQQRFGSPLNQRPAVGDPPITRWEYADFVVYFEYRYVIHSVLKRR